MELDEIKQKFQAMEAERKAFFTQAQIARQRNKEIIEALQKENRELKETIKMKVRKIGIAKDWCLCRTRRRG